MNRPARVWFILACDHLSHLSQILSKQLFYFSNNGPWPEWWPDLGFGRLSSAPNQEPVFRWWEYVDRILSLSVFRLQHKNPPSCMNQDPLAVFLQLSRNPDESEWQIWLGTPPVVPGDCWVREKEICVERGSIRGKTVAWRSATSDHLRGLYWDRY